MTVSKRMALKKDKTKTSSKITVHQVRIVGGIWKRTPLAVADVPVLRPTPDRVRETLFNWLTHLKGNTFSRMRCLDLFAGTGALSFEAASRGFSQVVTVEESRTAYSHLEAVKKKLNAEQVKIVHADAFAFADRLIEANERFDVIFLDPPFQENFLPVILPMCVKLLSDGGLIYVESNEAVSDEKLDQLLPEGQKCHICRENKAGQVYYHLLEMKASGQS